MDKKVINIPLGDGKERIRVRLESEQCDPGTFEYRFYKADMFQQIANNPELLNCGLNGFDWVKIYHNGFCWIADAEAVVSTA